VKVLLTHELFAPDFRGGGEYVRLETARGLMKRGVDVQVLTTGDPELTNYEGIPTTRLPVGRRQFNLEALAIARVAGAVDLIHTAFYHACLPSLVAGKLVRKPVVADVMALFQDVWLEEKTWPLGTLYSAWERFLLRRGYSALLFFSDFSLATGLKLGVDPAKAFVICPGIEANLYRPETPKQNVVLFSGKLDARKGIYEFLDVARALPAVRFSVMGWGPNQTAIRRLASPNVEFVPYARDLLAQAYAEARIFLLPTKAETFGIALVQAMASGCAVVSTLPMAFEGIRVNPGDRGGMIKAVETLWADTALTADMGDRNIDLARRYTWDSYITELIRVYERVLADRRSRS
jgi:glycosyltransferase involved in cell wall biosynthesis